MDRKICVVTGATNGVGLETARALANRGATVAVLGRNGQKGAETLASLRKTARHPDALRFFQADLADLSQVRRLGSELGQAYPRIDVLINNAGLINARRRVTVDGFEETFAVNHLAHFLLTGLLLEPLRAAPAARIVNLSSNAHLAGRLDLDDLNREHRRYSTFGAYGDSKLANLYFTYELARRLSGTPITVNAVHPGAVASGFSLNNGGVASFVMGLVRPFFLSSEKGALTSIHVASAPELAGVTGRYFYKSREKQSSKLSHDTAIAQRLWALSETMTGIRYP
ncbi:NAD(P)-dependent dehydrogenase, short-chain alcohol dehydrogenase family [Devosia enhydra]|uniref:NAD(P)-dependent dehydrogenase, short-chain alcohol dehydrogenase family n=1 Tax=Devosia enhydra TaxID=665118 RepID=A0A1K2HVL8_9HYPH|nr:SDR family oxidoreductase [Devosia enhydra]SFZ82467.1 NAD(P)-dependent dehydrogenase, short-chain alcohol dehydrogenase family [Devosia enhydra]